MRLDRHTWTVVLACAAMAAAVIPAFGQAGGKDDEKAAMEAMAKAGAPGSEHKQLEAMAGTWTTEATAWMGPDQPPVKTKGESQITSLLGGRFVREEHKSEFMGMPFVGTGLTGYDNLQKKYVTTWADTMSTSLLTLTGTYDAAKKSYSYEGTFPDPMTGQVKPVRMAVHVPDANKHVLEWWDPMPDGKWVKIMEIVYTRK